MAVLIKDISVGDILIWSNEESTLLPVNTKIVVKKIEANVARCCLLEKTISKDGTIYNKDNILNFNEDVSLKYNISHYIEPTKSRSRFELIGD